MSQATHSDASAEIAGRPVLNPGAGGSAAAVTAPALQHAITAHSAGRYAEADALCRQLLLREPANLPARHLRAMAAASRGNHPYAIKLLREVLEREPAAVRALNQLAHLLWIEGRSREAIDLCRRALKLAPALAETHDNLGMALIAAGKFSEAAASFRLAVALNRGVVSAHYHLAIARELQGRARLSSTGLDRVISECGGSAEAAASAYAWMGRALQKLGQFDEAHLCFRRAIALDPSRTAPWLDIIYGMKVRATDRPLIDEVRVALNSGLNHRSRANLHFALGKAFDDLHQFADAITHFDEANRIVRQDYKFDRVLHVETIEWLERTFTPDFCRREFPGASRSDMPIMIFGMPRSGTTLVEQILSRHPAIAAGGELMFWGDAASIILPEISSVSANALPDIAADYLSLLSAIAPVPDHVTDKMPSNFFRLGLIHHMFPRAHFIHCRRNPLDTCLSIYFTQFDTGHEYAYDRGDIVFYYQCYQRLMEHWRRALPEGRMLEIHYEQLVTDPERLSRQLLAYCGLDWDEHCLRPQTSPRVVKTASKWQARQPVYTSSRARWRNYESWLGEFRNLQPGTPE